MKYICTISDYGEEIFIFPMKISHDAMAEVLDRVKNQTHGNWERVMRTPISAGFVDISGTCFGESETLGLKSREIDTKLLSEQHRKKMEAVEAVKTYIAETYDPAHNGQDYWESGNYDDTFQDGEASGYANALLRIGRMLDMDLPDKKEMDLSGI